MVKGGLFDWLKRACLGVKVGAHRNAI